MVLPVLKLPVLKLPVLKLPVLVLPVLMPASSRFARDRQGRGMGFPASLR